MKKKYRREKEMQKHKQMFKFKMLSYGRFVQSKNTDEHNETTTKKKEEEKHLPLSKKLSNHKIISFSCYPNIQIFNTRQEGRARYSKLCESHN